ncbi:GNAT family N-acetyltransferase [Aquimarina sp. RZ0]|uniref:GNAT family N-acetyltransferase n=1 Tax=Aquimarina sp. RZ0 TaxID=2607730 RepID=UPI0011F3D9C1|nr:GNAT family N-acetyltransferase [Aquimarina sp. RZ0]KAA1244577.1 GNAT family N-acetyltransferase [Aquimarina sp. RZ0]
MLQLLRTNSHHTDFIELVKNLDKDLKERDGEDHAFYAQFNTIDTIKYVVIAYENEIPVGCGAIKEYDPVTVEIKRMYTAPGGRGKGVATQVLLSLEKWANELSYTRCVLETGIRQPEAIGLYKKSGYYRIPNYDQYKGVEDSLCFEKLIPKDIFSTL